MSSIPRRRPTGAGSSVAGNAVAAPAVAAPPDLRGTRLLLTHAEYGIFIGTTMGLGFWSKLEPAGQSAAVTFEDQAQVHEAIKRMGIGPIDNFRLVPVHPDDGVYASIAVCVRAGLDGWIDAQTPTVSNRPS